MVVTDVTMVYTGCEFQRASTHASQARVHQEMHLDPLHMKVRVLAFRGLVNRI